MAKLLSINAGRSQALLITQPDGPPRRVQTALRKNSISSLDDRTAIEIGPLGVVGDEQVDLSVHGGLDKAVYAFSADHYPNWKIWLSEAGGDSRRMAHFGAFGENLTVEGFNEQTVFVGDFWHIGEVVLRVTEARSPCFKFTALMQAPQAAKYMLGPVNQAGTLVL